MNQESIDTRITDYVFGELSSEQVAAFEKELAASPTLQAEVSALRETVGALGAEFGGQTPELDTNAQNAVNDAIMNRVVPPPIEHATMPDNLAMHHRLKMLGSLAAGFLIACVLIYPYMKNQQIALSTGELSSVANEDELPAKQDGNITQASAVADTDEEVGVLFESFNEMMNQQRYQEAEVIANRIAQIKPEDPLSAAMFQSSQMGKELLAGSDPSNTGTAGYGYSPVIPLQSAQNPVVAELQAAAIGGASEPNMAEFSMGGSASGNSGSGESQRSEAILTESLSSNVEMDVDSQSGQQTKENSPFPPSDKLAAIELFGDQDSDGAMDSIWADSGLPVQPAKPRRRRGRNMGMDGEMMDLMVEDEMMMGMDDMGGGGAGMGGGAMGMGGMGMAMDMDMGMFDGMHDFGMMPERSSGDRFEPIHDNSFASVSLEHLSTFSVDVDTASYAKVRAMLNRNALPNPDSVRIEELLNYFDYDYELPPQDDEHPFAASMQIATCPWSPDHRLARIGIQGKVIEDERPSSNLVFLLDVSGSMDEPNKLPLVIEGMKMLTNQLTENDKVAIVVYAGASGMVLDSTRGDKKRKIASALDRLKAGGSTNGGQGIVLAYQLAMDHFIVGGTNRVILCSDGDFNVGVTGTDELVALAEKNAQSNVFLSVLGFGIGNHNDEMMEKISNKGNGNYAFIDSKAEARKVLVEELGGTLVTIAKDVKIQVEFNPREVASYRLIGYENRMLAAEDFNDDKKDAGEIGAGHTVTALYELVPAKSAGGKSPAVDPLRYQRQTKLSKESDSGEMLVLKLRYKQPDGDKSTLIHFPVKDVGLKFSDTDRDFRFASSVAAFGMLLRDSPHKGKATMHGVARIARNGAKGDETGYRIEFVELVAKARQLLGG